MSERVLTDKITMRPYGDDGWAFSDDGCGCGAGGLAVMQTGGEPFAVEQHIAGCGDDDLPARVIVALAARISELELDREGRIRSSDYDKALIEELEAKVAVLSGTACAEEQAEGNGPCGACRTCRNKRITELEAENAYLAASQKTLVAEREELEAENAKLRKCVAAADDFVETVVIIETSQAMLRVYSVALAHGAPYNGMDWSKQLSTYRAARAEVDK